MLKRHSIFQLLAVASIAMVLHAPRATAENEAGNPFRRYYKLGESLYRKGDYKNAVRAFQTVLTDNARDTNAIYYVASCYQKLGDKSRARSQFVTLIKDHPDSPAASLARQALGIPPNARVETIIKSKPTALAVQTISKANPRDLLPDSDSVPFRRTTGGHLLVDGQINGRAQSFIFDTGAESCLIAKKSLLALGIAPPTGEPTGASTGVSGSIREWEMNADITVGKIRRNIEIGVAESGFEGLPLLGQTFFGAYHYDIDNSDGCIRFTKRGAKAAAVPHDTINVPFTRMGNECVVEAEVNGIMTKLIFDTGAQDTVMTYGGGPGWSLLGRCTVKGVGGDDVGEVYEVDSISLGPIRQTRVRVIVMRRMPAPYGLLGQNFFGRRKFTIDYDSGMIRFFR
ncbi:MAG: retroviral-like aspartic protease family protein [Cyanobacteria bacterium]|nr:retroviral-like aspartic protease family protein [Cyanobacteriota bacterium]